MASNYAYYLRGRQIALLEQEDDTEEYKSPSKDVVAGIRFEYSSKPLITLDEAGDIEQTSTVTEKDYVQVDDYLAKALIYYLKARLSEDRGEEKEYEWFMRQFRSIIGKYERGASSYGIRQVFPPSTLGIK